MRQLGERIWKSGMEHNGRGLVHGIPYFIITADHKGEVYSLYEYDTESEEYVLLEELQAENAFQKLHKIGVEKDSVARDEFHKRFERRHI